MRNKITFHFILSFIIIICSCSNGNKYKKEIATLDSLSKIIDSTEFILNSIDTNKVISAQNEIIDNSTIIQSLYNDTMKRKDVIVMDKYNYIKKFFVAFLNQKEIFYDQIRYSREQVKNLSHDLKKELLEEDKTKEYLSEEESEINDLNLKVKKSVNEIEQCLPVFEQTTPGIKLMIDSLRLHQKV